MATQVVMPQLGESVVEGTIGRWLKREGESINEYEGLLEVESDKVDTEIPSPASGTVIKILVPEGQTVSVGTVLAVIGQAGESAGDNGEPSGQAQPTVVAEPAMAAPAGRYTPDQERGSNGPAPRVSPVVANIAAEHGVDVSQIPGTGMGGRV